MHQNKIYLNYTVEILKTFAVILLGLSIIALTIRAVNFLDLIVDSGYPVKTYFKYSLLNLSGITLKFIPFSFLIALMIFVVKHTQDNEFLILWTSGVKKIHLVNLFLSISILIFILYLLLSTLFTPFALNKSRQLLKGEDLNSFLPTIKSQQFNDTFKGLTIIVEKKFKNELQNIFIHDKGNNLKNLSSNISNTQETTIIAQKGIVEKKKIYLLNGNIISSKKNNSKHELIKFEQLSIDLKNIENRTIKHPKLQETATNRLLSCFIFFKIKDEICQEDAKREIIPALNRRLVLPFYIPVIALLCSLLLIKTERKYLRKSSIFIYNFILLIFLELVMKYTGINSYVRLLFIFLPFFLISIFYFLLIFQFTKEHSIK